MLFNKLTHSIMSSKPILTVRRLRINAK